MRYVLDDEGSLAFFSRTISPLDVELLQNAVHPVDSELVEQLYHQL